MDKIRQYATLALLLSATFLIVATAIYVIQIGRHATATLIEIQATAKHVRELVDDQGTMLRSDDAQRLVRQNLAVGAGVMSVIRSLNVGTLPKINRAIDQINTVGVEMANLTAQTNRSVNLSLLPEIKRTIQDTDEAIKDASDNLDDAFRKLTPEARATLESATKTINSLDTRINDPAITTTLNELSATATEIRQSSENLQFATVSIKDTLSYAPEVGKNVAKFSRSQNKITWAVAGVRLLKIWF